MMRPEREKDIGVNMRVTAAAVAVAFTWMM